MNTETTPRQRCGYLPTELAFSADAHAVSLGLGEVVVERHDDLRDLVDLLRRLGPGDYLAADPAHLLHAILCSQPAGVALKGAGCRGVKLLGALGTMPLSPRSLALLSVADDVHRAGTTIALQTATGAASKASLGALTAWATAREIRSLASAA